MSSNKCDKCGLPIDLCVCKEEAEEAIRVGLSDGTLIRCSKCGNPFSPDSFSDTLCGDCRGEPAGQPVGDEPVVEPDVIDSGVRPVGAEPVIEQPETTAPAPTFSAIPEGLSVSEEEKKTEIPVPQEVTVKINENAGIKASDDADLVAFEKHPETQTIVLKGIVKDTGRPIEMTLSEDYVLRLVREFLPDEKKRQQELLDKMHGIRKTRGLSVEKIDKMLTDLMDEAEKKFDACKTGTDVKKTEAMFRAKLAVLTQKRYLAKFSIQEESELSLQLAKLQHGEE